MKVAYICLKKDCPDGNFMELYCEECRNNGKHNHFPVYKYGHTIVYVNKRSNQILKDLEDLKTFSSERVSEISSLLDKLYAFSLLEERKI